MSGTARYYRWDGKDLILDIRVQPRASKDELCGTQQDRLKIRITAPPVDGKANTHLIRFLSNVFSVPKSRISLISGQTGREKRLRIHNPSTLPTDIQRPKL